ncbi:hypothetical protein LSA03nite_19060 [Latilactobacillus sakei subsp. carnosus]|nr:helix-turn-helix domain-containing protein [Latilactobacillus sakei]GEP22318.1 hypothetical protein LSA03nite_19060 [Latilactobacillus sakei subsp. carnosus]
MQEQNTTVRKKGQHLTSFERGRIATLHSQGYSNRAIARALNVCHQTINNELCRGEIDQVKKVNGQRQYYAVYSPETAQAKYEANRAHCHRPLKLVGVADLYYAHPYRSSERGTNEAHNRMIRRDVPKGLSMDILGPHDIQAVESKLNNLPRRQTGYQTPKELFSAASAG